ERFQQVRKQVDGKLGDCEIEPRDVGDRKAGCSQHQADVSVTGDEADREGACSPGTFEHDCGNGDRGKRKQECKRGKLDDQNGIGAKMIDGAVHGGNGEHRHCDHAQAVNGLSLCLDKSAARNEANTAGGEGAACDDQEQSESKFERRGKRRSQKDMSEETGGKWSYRGCCDQCCERECDIETKQCCES